MSRSRMVAALLAALVVLGLAAIGLDGVESHSDRAHGGEPGTGGAQLAAQGGQPAPARPNVIFILTDDMDKSLVQYMPNVEHLIRDQGADLTNFYVEQSSCCPSRASILSGDYAHNHGVIGNTWPEGGYDRWKDTLQDDDLPVWLDKAGYRSALLGKYFNEYPFHPGTHASEDEKQQLREYVPPGWQSWAAPVQGNAYAQFHYKLNVDGQVDADFHSDYLDSWLGDRLLGLVNGSVDDFDFAAGGQFVYYASYSPHTPYAFPPQLDGTYEDQQYPRTPDFDEADVSDKFGETRRRAPLTADQISIIDETFRKRIRSLQVLDANVAKLVQDLANQDALDNTYIIFTSDNGYHMGNHRREIGKYTQFQTDVSVPFFVRGPGITPGSTYDDVAGNIDIAPTIAQIAGAQTPQVDGVSLLDLLHDGTPLTRKYYLLGRALAPSNDTSRNGLEEPVDPNGGDDRSSRLNDFTGVTNGRYKLVKYTDIPHEELYDDQNDPYELTNLLAHDEASYDAMSPQAKNVVDTLRAELATLVDCAGASCQ